MNHTLLIIKPCKRSYCSSKLPIRITIMSLYNKRGIKFRLPVMGSLNQWDEGEGGSFVASLLGDACVVYVLGSRFTCTLTVRNYWNRLIEV